RVQLALGDLGRGAADGRGDLGIDTAEIQVDLGAGALDQAHGPDEAALEAAAADRGVLDGPLRLGSVIGPRGALHLAHRNPLARKLAHAGLASSKVRSDR